MTTITYFDLASEYYMAYPLDGLLAEAPTRSCRIRICKESPSLLSMLALASGDRERLFALGLFRVNSDNGAKWFCIDAHDDAGPKGYFRPILEKVDHYFKLNCNPAAFEEDRTLGWFRAKVHSLPCTFAIRPAKPWRFLPRLRPCKSYGWNWFCIKRRLRALQRIPDLQRHRALRLVRPEHDVFLVRRYYREACHAQSNELYARIFEAVKNGADISGALGFTGVPADAADRYRRHAFGQDRPYRAHLNLIARSRACIYAPGTHNCVSFKFGQYLALGKPVVGMKLPFWPIQEMDKNDKALLEEQFCCTEPEDVVAKMVELLRDAQRQEFLKANNIRIFERYLSPRAVACHILNHVL